MSSDNSEILIRALEASGSEREANLARAILGNPAAPAADPAEPAAAPAPAGVPGTTPGTPPGGLPEGIMTAEEIAAYEAAGGSKGLPYREQVKAVERFVNSVDYHEGQR
jgi:hypothetical protein